LGFRCVGGFQYDRIALHVIRRILNGAYLIWRFGNSTTTLDMKKRSVANKFYVENDSFYVH
jgi:hypothetical protein